jgi:Cu/Ag efflux protein CusF
MVTLLYRPLAIGLLPVVLVACMSSGPIIAGEDAPVPVGINLGGSGPVAVATRHHATADQNSGEMQMVHEGHNDAHGTGTVNFIDPAQHKVNVSHNPIPEIGWPAMTMDFPVAASVDLKPVKPGTRVNFTIEKGQDGIYEIKAITPAGGTR